MPIPKTKTTVGKVCEVCAETFYIYPSGASKGRFCSRACWVKYSALPDEEENATGWRKPTSDPKTEKSRKKARAVGIRRRRKKALAGLCELCEAEALPEKRYCSFHRPELLKRSIAYKLKIQVEAFAAYGDKCSCCGDMEQEFLQIDHVNGWGKAHRDKAGRRVAGAAVCRWARDNGYPSSLRLLCANCHFSVTKYGTCIHARKGKDGNAANEQSRYLN